MKEEGSTWNPVDPDRAARLVQLVRAYRERRAA
jgi:predicted TIM-barrel enzyme